MVEWVLCYVCMYAMRERMGAIYCFWWWWWWSREREQDRFEIVKKARAHIGAVGSRKDDQMIMAAKGAGVRC